MQYRCMFRQYTIEETYKNVNLDCVPYVRLISSIILALIILNYIVGAVFS